MDDQLRSPLVTTSMMNRRSFLQTASLAAAGALGNPIEMLAQPSTPYSAILIPKHAHPAVRSAAELLAIKLGEPKIRIETYSGKVRLQRRRIVFALQEAPGVASSAVNAIQRDGYAVMAARGGILVCGARPRSLLFAAGEPHHWRQQTQGIWARNPEFALRFGGYHLGRSVAEQAAILGVNTFTAPLHASVSLKQRMPEVYARLPLAEQQRLDQAADDALARNRELVKEFHDADLEVFADLPYGNNFSRWSPSLYEAFLAVYPSARGVPEPHSWEKAALCPSDPETWRLFRAYVEECAIQSQADGISATFWDQYGIFCHDPRCRADGLDCFKNELHAAITNYYAVVQPMGKRLHLRTWSSGCPHWLGDQYVHAPGYGQFSESHYDLWSKVIDGTAPDVLMQTKVYHSDCEPDPPFSTLLGKCKPHTEIVEYQIVGQTLGRQYFPASTVNYLSWTLKKSLALIGPEGGAEITAGGTMQTNYDIYADILNSAKVYAWRELTWNVNANPDEIWSAWSAGIYSPQAAPHVAKAMQISEDAVYKTFSPLGLGSSTNSDFAGNIARRETLLRYTNRYYLPEYAKYLEPTRENIERIVAEKQACLDDIKTMIAELDAAKPFLTAPQAAELQTRFHWFQEFAICNVTLDVSLWRFRYLRALAARLTTDPEQLKSLAAAFDTVSEHAGRLFEFDPEQKFACYDVPLGQLHRKPDLGSPLPLMHEIYTRSLAFMEDSVGPDYLPQDLLRASVNIDIQTEQHPSS